VADQQVGEPEGDERAGEERHPHGEDRLPGPVVDRHRRRHRPEHEQGGPDQVLGERVVLEDVGGDVAAVPHLDPGLLRRELRHRPPHQPVERHHPAVVAGGRPEPDRQGERGEGLARPAAGHLAHHVAVGEAPEERFPRAGELLEEPLHVRRRPGGPSGAAPRLPGDPGGERVPEPDQVRPGEEEEQPRLEEVPELVDPVLDGADQLPGRAGEPLGQVVGEELQGERILAGEDHRELCVAAHPGGDHLEIPGAPAVGREQLGDVGAEVGVEADGPHGAEEGRERAEGQDRPAAAVGEVDPAFGERHRGVVPLLRREAAKG